MEGEAAELVNSVTLNNKENDGTGFKAVAKSRSSDDVPIPGVFTKKLTGKPEEDNWSNRRSIPYGSTRLWPI